MHEKRILQYIKQAKPLNPLAYAHDIVRDYAAENLSQVMLACREVNPDEFRTTWFGNTRAPIMIINDRPTVEQYESGHIYSMQNTEELEMLRKVFSYFGYEPDDLFFIDAINCLTYREIDNEKVHRLPSKQEVDSCKVFVDHAIDIVRPRAILGLGTIPCGMYLPEAFTKVRGQMHQMKGVPGLVTHHPAKMLDSERYSEEDIADMKDEFITDIENLLKHI